MTIAHSVTGREDERVAQEILARVKVVIQPALDRALARAGDEQADLLGHHFDGGGKHVRAGLSLLTARACGATEEDALTAAVAIELVHNFSLIHDDIIDRDVQRRHRPSVWARYGVGPAIIAGDALCTLAFQLLLDHPTPPRVAAAARLAESTQEMIRGQAEDMAAESRASLSVAECLTMIEGKTGALFSCSTALGAIVAGAPAEAVETLSETGRHLGLAFQAVDDVLGIWGDPSVTGKPIGNDLRRRKKSLPVCVALAKGVDVYASAGSPVGQELSDAEVAAATAQLEACGARRETLDRGEAELRQALAGLEAAPLTDGGRADLAVIARYVVGRTR